MSVLVRVEFVVDGTDDPEAVENALLARDRHAWPEMSAPIWFALQEAGVDAYDVTTDDIYYEALP